MNRVNIEDISVNIEAKAEQTDERQRDYLTSRLREVYWSKDHDLRKQYGLVGDDSPAGAKELLARIQAGKYVLDEKNDRLEWRDPSIKEDRAGYKAAEKVMDKLFSDAQDDIRIQSPTDGLKTLRTFRDAAVVTTTQ